MLFCNVAKRELREGHNLESKFVYIISVKTYDNVKTTY